MAEFPVEHVQVSSFGPIFQADAEMSPQLNVVVGDNGSGKSQLLKLIYSSVFSINDRPGQGGNKDLLKTGLERQLAQKFLGTFRPDELGRLVTRQRGSGRAEIDIKFSGLGDSLRFSFSSRNRSNTDVLSQPKKPLQDTAVFLPSRELLSIYPGFVSLYETTELEFDETWRDTCLLLGMPSLRGRREQEAAQILEPLQAVLRGNVSEEQGRFYLKRQGSGKFEAHLMAEGERKLAMLVRLVSSGALLEGGYLFWDEPEANLNPKSQLYVAQVIALLAKAGTQVFVATHSLFLLRELQMLAAEQKIAVQYLGLELQEEGIILQSENDLDMLPFIPALEAEAEQSHRYLSW